MNNENTQNQPTVDPQTKPTPVKKKNLFSRIGNGFKLTGTFLKSTVVAVLVGAIAATATFIIKGCYTVANAIVKAVDDTGYNRRPNETSKEHIERLQEEGGTIGTAATVAKKLEPIAEPIKEATEPVVKALDDRSLNQGKNESEEEYNKRLQEEGSPTIKAAAEVASWLKSRGQKAQPLTPEQLKEVQDRVQAQH
ncbi:MAG: hypothetical protein J6Y85_01330 [Alphaproteobacteria bacterium]|nr:hypothetical protein [Alphaproteobacteria bacterium]